MRRLGRLQWLWLLLCLLACTRASTQEEIVLFAASSLTDAFSEIARAYEQAHPGTTVRLNLAASSQLALQLAEGARADLFASADAVQMERIIEAGRVAPTAPHRFARNQLVLIIPADNPARLETWRDLARPGIKVVLAGPEVPAGRYTHRLVASLEGQLPGFAAALQANVVSEESNVRQVVTKVLLGEADAGVVYASDVTPVLQERLHTLPLPLTPAVEIHYPIAPLRDSANPEGAASLLAFILSPEGQAILARWGFLPP